MKHFVPISMLLTLTAVACSSAKTDPQTSGTDPSAPAGPELAQNPIDGIAPATSILEAGEFTDGPIWHAGQGVLFFNTPLGQGGLYRMTPDGKATQVRAGNAALGTTPIGNTIAENGDLVTVEAKMLVRGAPESAAPAQIATAYPGTAPGSTGGRTPFDTLNDAVLAKDGNIYVTDPGYYVQAIANRIYRVSPQGEVTVVEAFEDVPRPNGIALSPDQKTLYVGFTQPNEGTLPYIRKYSVNADGSLGDHAKFADVGGADSSPDGIEVDQAGNVYVAAKEGIMVFKPDGSTIGTVAIPEEPTGMAFGGADLKTLYVTTQGVKIWQLTVNVPGIVQ